MGLELGLALELGRASARIRIRVRVRFSIRGIDRDRVRASIWVGVRDSIGVRVSNKVRVRE